MHVLEIANAVLAQVPDPSPVAPPSVAAKVDTALGFARWIGIVLALAGLLIGMGIVAVSERTGSGQAASTIKDRLGTFAIVLIVLATAPQIATFLLA